MTKITQEMTNASLAKLKEDINVAIQSANTMRDKVQHALVGCVSHWKLTGSNTGLAPIINEFIKELGQGVNLNAVKAWCEEHLHMIEDLEGKRLVFKAVKVEQLDTKKANECKWWTLKPQQVFSFDLKTAILALEKKAKKAQEELEKDPEADVQIDPAIYAQLMQLSNTVQATA